MRKAFTLIELLVVVVIVAILAAMMLGALNAARNSAREAATKATIAKLNNIVMQRYESYLTRRIGFDTTNLTPAQIAAKDAAIRATSQSSAWYRLNAIRDLMRMEMPDAKTDITNGPITFTVNGESWRISEPPLHKLYAANPPTAILDPAQCLYLLVSMGSPESMEQFRQSEIGIWDGRPVFIDGWGNPIMWLRWAPGVSYCPVLDFVGCSTLQSGVAKDTIVLESTNSGVARCEPVVPKADPLKKRLLADHDPFDSRNIDLSAFHLIPFIYSSGGIKKADGTPNYGIDLATGWNNGVGYVFKGNPYECPILGAPIAGQNVITINNHYIEQR
jgi:prepilin-type N-terminal cleavage/methylation domain-containing protein